MKDPTASNLCYFCFRQRPDNLPEYGRQCKQVVGEKQWMLAQPNGQRSKVDKDMHLKHEDEERPKVFEHFREEVPENADIRCQIGNGEQKAVCRAKKFPRIFHIVRKEE